MSPLSSNAPYSEVDSLSLESLGEAESLILTNSLLSTHLMTTIKAVLTEHYVAPFSWVEGRPPTLILCRPSNCYPETLLCSLFPDGNTVTVKPGQLHTSVARLTELGSLLFQCLQSFAFQRKLLHVLILTWPPKCHLSHSFPELN